MRKQIKVIGIGHKSGTNKAGKAYDFYILHATAIDEGTEGLSAVSINIPDHFVPTIKIGREYLLFSHFYNGRECFDDLFDCC